MSTTKTGKATDEKATESKNAELLAANSVILKATHKSVADCLKAYMKDYESMCAEARITPELKVTEMTEAQIETAVQGVMGALGIVNTGPVERNWAEYSLFYLSMAIGAVAGTIDGALCHIPGYRKNIKAGFVQGFALGNYLERRLYETSRDYVKGSYTRMTEAYETRKKQNEVKNDSPVLAPA